MGTTAIAAQGMTNTFENLNGILAIGIGVGLMTVVGETLGAGRKKEAVYYVKKLSIISEIVINRLMPYSCMPWSVRSLISAAWSQKAQSYVSIWSPGSPL